MVAMLLRHGADPNQRNANGQTPLAIILGSPSINRRFQKAITMMEYGAVPTSKLRQIAHKKAEAGGKKFKRQSYLTQKLFANYNALAATFQ
jgi:ankyrin repeat protein